MYHSKKYGSKITTGQIMKIFRLEISKYTYGKLLAEITEILNFPPASLQERGVINKGKAIFTPNPEICLKTLEDEEFLDVLKKADYLMSDGIGLYLAYQINDFLSLWKREYPQGAGFFKIISFLMLPVYIFNILFRKQCLYKKYGERICWSDLTQSLVEYAEGHGIRIAIIDPYYPKDLQKCESQRTFREKLTHKFPQLKFDFYVYSDKNADEIFWKIWSWDAQILFSTLGMKKQEISVIRGLESCPNIRIGLGIGSSFDYHTWFQKRAPKILRTLGFEWLYRIFTSPWKIKRLGRIYQALIMFPIKVITYKK